MKRISEWTWVLRSLVTGKLYPADGCEPIKYGRRGVWATFRPLTHWQRRKMVTMTSADVARLLRLAEDSDHNGT